MAVSALALSLTALPIAAHATPSRPATNIVDCGTSSQPPFAEIDGDGGRYCFANAGDLGTDINHVRGIWSGNNVLYVFYYQRDAAGKYLRTRSQFVTRSTYFALDGSAADNEVVRIHIY
jgi:hypothetical protein